MDDASERPSSGAHARQGAPRRDPRLAAVLCVGAAAAVLISAVSWWFPAARAVPGGSAGNPSDAVSAAATTAASVASTPSPSPMPTAYAGTVFAIGDSVMLGAKPCMEDLGFTVDAVESRSFWDGEKDILAAVADDTLTDRVVVHLGTNGPFAASDFDSLMEAVGDRDVYWMTIHTRDTPAYEFRNDLNDLIRAQVARWPNAHLIDYAAIGAALTEEERAHWYWNDGTHLRPGGCREFAAMIDDAVRQPA